MVNLSFAKLVATPTDTQWSQVYNAGNLFACLSLSKESEDTESQLNQIGKEMFSHLESEFFTLEEKSLQSIKEALANSTHILPSHVDSDLCLAYFKGNILYVFIYGRGSIVMKRNDKVGILLEKTDAHKEITSASGLLEQDDIVLLQTYQFAKDISVETITSALELSLPNDIAEALSPAMHEKDDGGQAAIIINYKEPVKPQPEPEQEPIILSQAELEDVSEEEKPDETTLEDAIEEDRIEAEQVLEQNQFSAPSRSSLPKFKIPSFFASLKKLDHRKKIFLSIAVLIALVLVMSVSFTNTQREQNKTTTQFREVYDPALKSYNEGIDLKSLNNDLSRANLLKSQKALKNGKGKFKEGSSEEKQITELLSKVEKELGGAGSQNQIKPKEVNLDSNDFLGIVKANSSGEGFAKDANTTYFVTDKAIVSVSGTGSKKDIIENDDDWEKAVGLSTYQGNMYVLDQTNGVLKFTAGSSGFGKTNYFKTKPSTISNASAIAIDGSVWILFKDGSIMKFTRGESDGFKVKALDKPFKSPTKLFTNLDTENLYVLDNGNSRIVKLDKDGNFQTQYNAAILKDAKDLEVSEKDGKITVLSGGKFFEIPL